MAKVNETLNEVGARGRGTRIANAEMFDAGR